MSHLGTITGVASLIVSGEVLGQVEYSISVSEDYRGLRHAEGRIFGSIEARYAALNSEVVHLALSNGERVKILLRNADFDLAYSDIRASGKIPGII